MTLEVLKLRRGLLHRLAVSWVMSIVPGIWNGGNSPQQGGDIYEMMLDYEDRLWDCVEQSLIP